MKANPANRRDVLKTALAAAASVTMFPKAGRAQTATKIVVIGGGFGGAACARALRRADPKLQVTLVEPNRVYTACPMSNAVIAGLRDLKQQQFTYDHIAADGVTLAFAAATAINPAARTVSLAGGDTLSYDRLVLSPGIDFRWNALEGYSPEVATRIPHAWTDGEQIALLARQLASMPDGGLVVISVPVTPSRCPPAPYERASLIAHYLKTRNPRSKVVVLDAKDSFTMQRQFQEAWAKLYPGVLDYVPLSSGGLVNSVDAASLTVATDFDSYKAAIINIIPQQKAGALAEIAGVADRTGWCPVDPVSFESLQQKNIHVIGDSAIAGAMPRSASAATSQAQICAAAIVKLLAGEMPTAPTLTSSCYSLIAPGYAISQNGVYRPVGDIYNEIESQISPVNAPADLRSREAHAAETWFHGIGAEVWG